MTAWVMKRNLALSESRLELGQAIELEELGRRTIRDLSAAPGRTVCANLG